MRRTGSSGNSAVKLARRLKMKKWRDSLGCYLVEGPKLVSEAVAEGADILFAFFYESAEEGLPLPRLRGLAAAAEGAGAEVLCVPDKLFACMADTEAPQGTLAVLRKPAAKRVLAEGSCLVLDRLRDPGNVGALMSTAAAAGFTGVLAVKGAADLYAPKTVRAAAGALFRVNVTYADSAGAATELVKSSGKQLMAADARGDVSCYEADLSGDFALVIGNEGSGLDEAFTRAGRLLRVPMLGGSDSLNASAAAAVIMFEAVRQRLAAAQNHF